MAILSWKNDLRLSIVRLAQEQSTTLGTKSRQMRVMQYRIEDTDILRRSIMARDLRQTPHMGQRRIQTSVQVMYQTGYLRSSQFQGPKIRYFVQEALLSRSKYHGLVRQ